MSAYQDICPLKKMIFTYLSHSYFEFPYLISILQVIILKPTVSIQKEVLSVSKLNWPGNFFPPEELSQLNQTIFLQLLFNCLISMLLPWLVPLLEGTIPCSLIFKAFLDITYFTEPLLITEIGELDSPDYWNREWLRCDNVTYIYCKLRLGLFQSPRG